MRMAGLHLLEAGGPGRAAHSRTTEQVLCEKVQFERCAKGV